MKKATAFYVLLLVLSVIIQTTIAQVITYEDSWGDQGYSMKKADYERTVINYSISEFSFNEVEIDGQVMYSVSVPGVFLPGEEGSPDLPIDSRYIAVPSGAEVRVNILSQRIQQLSNTMIAPAPEIPAGTYDDPFQHIKNNTIYETNAFFPGEPVMISEITQIRGVDVVIVSISPFRYNPVSHELILHRDLEIEIIFEGGKQEVGDERLRSRWWDPVLYNQVLNSTIIPEVDYTQSHMSGNRNFGYEYVIITPDLPDFLAWADSIKQFRIREGIKTTVVTTAELGGNAVDNIKNYVNNAYSNWDIPPVAVLLLGDYSTGTGGITSELYPHLISTYPDFASDNYYADVTGNNLPDIVFARITANNATQLQVMVSKFLNYERNPPTSPDFYNKPTTCMGWQTERWFQICSEVVAGFFNTVGKNTTRINDVYTGDPSVDPWSTAGNTSTVLNYYGPNGLGYIPSTPQQLGGFTGGSSSNIVDAINDGSFMVMHRNHGGYASWGKPAFTTFNITQLTNVNNQLPYVFSMNCQTGAYHRSSDCLAERFHRHTFNGQNSGALGVLAASEVSYSFVNDVYLWGVIDNLFPDFMPAQSTTFSSNFKMPGFAAAAGKYHLHQSSWAGSSSTKIITYRLFHHHGDAFMKLYTEVPQNLAVNHPSALQSTQTSLQVTANSGSLIALTVNGEILGTANGTGTPVTFSFQPQAPGSKLIVTVTKQNFFRYSSPVTVNSGGPIAAFTASPTTLCSGNSVSFTDLSTSDPTSWSWSFPGGTPSGSTQRHPVVTYNTAGVYNVTLTASNIQGSSNITKSAFITVIGGKPVVNFSASKTSILTGESIVFTDQSSNYPQEWSWSFPGGSPASGNGTTHTVTYHTAGTYAVALTAGNCAGSNTLTKTAYVMVNIPPPVADFSASPTTVVFGEEVIFSDLSTGNPVTWSWSFPGGTPSTSNQQNPLVIYEAVGTYSVSLTATNAGGSNTKTRTGYITVWDGQVVYCDAGGLSWVSEWIAGVSIGNFINTSGAAGYTDFTGQTINAISGQSYNIVLTPGFSGNTRRQFWRIWIDFNQDGTFGADEMVFAANGERNAVTGSIYIPSNAFGSLRLRVAMKYNSAPAPCEIFAAGEVEDYTIFVSDALSQLPEAEFTGSPTTIFTGDQVQFNNASSHNPTSWLWSFPGGTPSSSTQSHPVVSYPQNGSYNVSLTVANSQGSSTKTKTNYIQVIAEPVIADFTADPTAINVGESIVFTDLSGGNPTSWSWIFEGGTPASSNEQNPVVFYSIAGTYNVTLTAANGSGSDTEIKTDFITVTDAATITYCESMGLSNALEWIAGVKIGNFINNSGPAGYSDFTGQFISLNPGATYSIALTPGFSGASQKEFWRVWIDFNGNGSFGDNGETVFSANNQQKAVTGQITIPAGAVGTARMRVSMKGGSSSSSCEIFNRGEVEDYIIDFGGTDYFAGHTENEILVYPNPFSQFLNIVTGNKPVEAFLYGMDGKLLRNIIVTDHHMLDLGNLRNGMYMLRLVSDEHTQVEKIIKR